MSRTDNEQVNYLKCGSQEMGHNGDLHGRMEALRKDIVTESRVKEDGLT